MIHATAQQDFFSTLPAVPSQRSRNRTPVIAPKAELPLRIPAEKKDRRWLEDAFSLILLSVVAGTAVVASAGMAREFLDQLMRLNSFDLMRVFGGM